jgi:hypothetical protein
MKISNSVSRLSLHLPVPLKSLVLHVASVGANARRASQRPVRERAAAPVSVSFRIDEVYAGQGGAVSRAGELQVPVDVAAVLDPEHDDLAGPLDDLIQHPVGAPPR